MESHIKIITVENKEANFGAASKGISEYISFYDALFHFTFRQFAWANSSVGEFLFTGGESSLL